ncbi:MAG: hypothetical protein ACJA19_000942 [Bacteroidia bacterium]
MLGELSTWVAKNSLAIIKAIKYMKKQILKINVMILLFGGSIIAKAQT